MKKLRTPNPGMESRLEYKLQVFMEFVSGPLSGHRAQLQSKALGDCHGAGGVLPSPRRSQGFEVGA